MMTTLEGKWKFVIGMLIQYPCTSYNACTDDQEIKLIWYRGDTGGKKVVGVIF